MSHDETELTWEDLLETPDPRFDLEVPVAGRWWLLEGPNTGLAETELEALMETAPNEPPRTSTEYRHDLADRLMMLMETELDDTERAVIEATIVAGHSIRRTADILGMPRSTVHRIQVSAINRLKKLSDDY